MLEASGVPVILAGGWIKTRVVRQKRNGCILRSQSKRCPRRADQTPAEVFGLLDEVGTIRVGGPATFGLTAPIPSNWIQN